MHCQLQLPPDWHIITHGPTHLGTMLDYINLIIIPLVNRIQDALGVGKEQAAMYCCIAKKIRGVKFLQILWIRLNIMEILLTKKS